MTFTLKDILMKNETYDSVVFMYVLFCIFCFHRASWHYSATLTDVFPCSFLGCKADARV
jgi:hypothetical protein